MVKNKLCLVCQVTPSSSQICKEVQMPYRRRDDYLFWMSAQYFFQLPKQILFGGWTGSCAPGDKRAQYGSSVGLHAVFHFMPQWLQDVIKKQKG